LCCSHWKKKYRTVTRNKDKNPVWNATFQDTEVNLFKKVHEIAFEVFDKDTLSKDDFIGKYVITIDDKISSMQTIPQWYPLVNEKNEKQGEIQFQLQFVVDIAELSVRNFTHVLEFTVKEGKKLRNMEWLHKDDPYVRLEWGNQVWKTKTVSHSDDPKWNETMYVFVDEARHREYRLRLSVLNENFRKNDNIGTGYIHAKEIFDKGKYNDSVKLTQIVFNLDKKLGGLETNAEEKVKECGEIIVEATLHTRAEIEKDFYKSLLEKFDVNGDGYLNKDEVKRMFFYLKMDNDDVSSDDFFVKFDKNGDDKLDANEIEKILSDEQFQDSELAPQLILNHLRKDNSSLSSALMSGFSRAEETNHRKMITLKDRKTGLLVQENIPSYIWLSMRLLYDNKTGRALSHNVKNIFKKMSHEKGEEYDKPQSTKEIPAFIALHSLDTSLLLQKVSDFKTFNDFFARPINMQARPMTKDENEIVSPADSRMMVFASILDSGIWVKGDKFTVANLLGPRKDIVGRYEGGAFCIARLAPQDYHRFHWPVSGTVTKITPIDGALYTVNPIAINKPLNVYTENKRCVVEIDSDRHGSLILFAVAATMVGCYTLFQNDDTKLKEGAKVKRGDLSGEFRFGGSTVLLLFEPNKVVWEEDVLKNSNESTMESLVHCRETIGKAK